MVGSLPLERSAPQKSSEHISRDVLVCLDETERGQHNKNPPADITPPPPSYKLQEGIIETGGELREMRFHSASRALAKVIIQLAVLCYIFVTTKL